MAGIHVKRAALLLLLCAALLTTAFAYAPAQRSDITIRITPPGGEAVQRAEVELEFTDNTGSGLQTAHVKVGGASWHEITGQLDRTDNRYRYVAEVTENCTVTARAIGQDGTVFEKSENIDCFSGASGEVPDKPEGEAASVKEERQPVPLTPAGQGTVLDSAGDEDGKEFFTFKTPNENVFYLVIDRQRSGENVYFLNAVTESDLMDLAEKGEENKTGPDSPTVSAVPEPEPEPVCICTEKCEAGMVNLACPVCVLSLKDCAGKAPAPVESTGDEKKDNGNGTGMIFVILAALAAGVAGYYFKIYKPKRELGNAEDFDELTSGEDEMINEDEDENNPAPEPEPEAAPFHPVEAEYEEYEPDEPEPLNDEAAEDEPEEPADNPESGNEPEPDFFDLA